MSTALNVALAILLCLVGFVSIFSIGAPLFLTGIAMLAVSPWRKRRDVLWPVLAGTWAFGVGYVAVAPLGCTATPGFGPLLPRTECTNVLGIEYAGSGSYDPPLLPAVLTGLAAAAVVALVVRVVTSRRTG